MNFTREPIIETVITPRDGCKLVVRSSKGNCQEEYQVDAVEVVSFGHSFFFRSIEKPRPFLVPAGDYEILELREARMALKSASPERSIKIGGGRDAPLRPMRENIQPEERHPEESQNASSSSESDRSDRKRDRRRRGRRGRDRMPMNDSPMQNDEASEEPATQDAPVSQAAEEPTKAPPSFMSKLFPPPPTLIKESLGRYKNLETPKVEEVVQETEEEIFIDRTEITEEDSERPHFDE